MTSRALIVQPVELKPNPPPYGRLSLRMGAWDQLQAKRAYDDHREPPEEPSELDKKV
ncbi:MAG: hypothetical protein V4477_02290 [Pseudomonadota bacterium]